MKRLTGQEILNIVEKNFTLEDFGYNDIDKNSYEALGLGTVEEVEQVGGEGEGETWYSVKYFKDHDVYIKTDAYYQSYDGASFNNGYGKEVKPQEKTIIVYE